jgi:hypothetical protein
MPVFLVILAMPFMVVVWIARYWIHYRARQTEEAMKAAMEKAELEARCARPLRDYVVSLKPGQEMQRIPLHPIGMSVSPPTLGNIGRFTALTVCRSGEQYFVRDEGGAVYGPADETTMGQWIGEGRIGAATAVSSHHDGPWLSAGHVRALQMAFQQAVRDAVSSNRFDHINIK